MAYTSAGGVAATFTVLDEFSKPLAVAQDQVAVLQKALNGAADATAKWAVAMARIGAVIGKAGPAMVDFSAAMKRAMPALTAGLGDAATSAAALDGSMVSATAAARSLQQAGAGLSSPVTRAAGAAERLDAALATADDRIGALAAGSARVQVALSDAARSGGLIGYAGGGGGGRRRAPPSVGDESFLGGATSSGAVRKLFHAPTLLEIGGVFIGYEAFKAALQTQYHVTTGVELFDPAALHNPARLAADKRKLTELAFSTSIGTIYSAEQTAEAYDILAAMLQTAPAFQGPNKWKNFQELAPIILRASEVATMRGLGNLQENMAALTNYAHLTGAYTPATMTAASKQLLAIAERTGMPLRSLEKAMAYSLPLARGLGANMSEAALLTGALIQGGLGTRAGYAVGEILTGVLQTGGPVTAAVQRALKELGLNGVAYKGKGLTAHIAALHNLGILNTAGKLTDLNAAGGIDIAKVIASIEAASKRLSPQMFENALQAAFGIRGMRGAALLKAMSSLASAFFKSIEATPTALQQQAAFAATSQQQFEQMVARLKDIGNIPATGILPAINRILNVIVPVFDWLDKFFIKNAQASKMAGGAALGAVVGGPPGAAIGAATGSQLAPVLTTQGRSLPGGMSGGRASEAAAYGDTIRTAIENGWIAAGAQYASTEWLKRPTGMPGDPVFVRPVKQPPAEENTTIHVSAPLNVTVQGSMIGTEAEWSTFFNDWWDRHSKQVGDSVAHQIEQQQKQRRRQSFLDPALAGVPIP